MTSTSFPGAVDSFTTKVDGSTDVMADHINYPQTSIVAIETYLRSYRFEENLLADTLTHDESWLAGTTLNDVTDNAYGPSLWRVLNTNPPDISAQAGGTTDPFTTYFRCTFDASNSRAGIVQFLTAQKTRAWRGATVSLSADLWGTNVANMKMAVIVWTGGTADSLASDPVSSWGDTPSLISDWAFIGAPANIAISGTRARYSVENLTIPTNAVNLGVFIWNSGLAGSGDLFNVARVKLEPGAAAMEFIGRDPGEELHLISRFYQKSFPLATAPAQNTGNTGAIFHISAVAGAVAARTGSVRFTRRMRGTPTITLYNPGATNAEARDLQAAADCSSTASTSPSDTQFAVNYTGNAGTVAGNRIAFHFVADARL